ncbi:MAG: 3,4-dihydroxy-2-butanone-4-phosphate synthase [Hyphomonadaceae bacterium]
MAAKLSPVDDLKRAISPIPEIIEEAREGRMFILVDAENRENEGDLVIPAQFATPAAVNFMAKHGRGLICLALTDERTRQLGLEPMAPRNQARLGTAFTVSIEAKEGISTGISAADRARTIAVAIDASKDAADIVSPGHVFPLTAREGGVLVRAGHTEASVDISRQAGLNPSAVICEIMNDDGTMARLPELIAFAQFHNLKIGAIDELIAFRRANDRYIDKLQESAFETRIGKGFRLVTSSATGWMGLSTSRW